MQSTAGSSSPNGDPARDVSTAIRRVESTQEQIQAMTSLLQTYQSTINRLKTEAGVGGWEANVSILEAKMTRVESRLREAEAAYEEGVDAYNELAAPPSCGKSDSSHLALFERQAQSIRHRIQTKQFEIRQIERQQSLGSRAVSDLGILESELVILRTLREMLKKVESAQCEARKAALGSGPTPSKMGRTRVHSSRWFSHPLRRCCHGSDAYG